MIPSLATVQMLAQRDYDYGRHGDGEWWVMMLGMLGFWAVLIFGAIWLVRSGRLRGGGHQRPLAILQRRLAEGDITPQEYEDRRAVLLSKHGGVKLHATSPAATPEPAPAETPAQAPPETPADAPDAPDGEGAST